MGIDILAINIVFTTLTRAGLNVTSLNFDTRLADLPIDSTDCLDLQFRLERECQCKLPTIHQRMDIHEIIEIVAAHRK